MSHPDSELRHLLPVDARAFPWYSDAIASALTPLYRRAGIIYLQYLCMIRCRFCDSARLLIRAYLRTRPWVYGSLYPYTGCPIYLYCPWASPRLLYPVGVFVAVVFVDTSLAHDVMSRKCGKHQDCTKVFNICAYCTLAFIAEL